MTKRAGKKKNKLPPDPPKAPEPVVPAALAEGGLDPKEALELEMRALREGWLDSRPEFRDVRLALINKVAGEGIKAADPSIAIKALRAVATTEQRAQALRLQAIAIALRPQGSSQGELPAQVNVQINNGAPVEPAVTRKPTYQVIQELIRRREVRDALANPTLPSAE